MNNNSILLISVLMLITTNIKINENMANSTDTAIINQRYWAFTFLYDVLSLLSLYLPLMSVNVSC